MSTEYNKQLALKKEMLEEIEDINFDLLHPSIVSPTGSSIPVDECEDGFLGKNEWYEEWGDKSWNILNYIQLEKPSRYISVWKSSSNTYKCKFCNAVTYNDSPDCNECKEKFCMYATC